MDYPVVIYTVRILPGILASPCRSGTREGENGIRVVVRSCTSGCWSKRHSRTACTQTETCCLRRKPLRPLAMNVPSVKLSMTGMIKPPVRSVHRWYQLESNQ